MGEGKPGSTPNTPQTTTGGAAETHGANTNLDPNMQGGPATQADQRATNEVVEENRSPGAEATSGQPTP